MSTRSPILEYATYNPVVPYYVVTPTEILFLNENDSLSLNEDGTASEYENTIPDYEGFIP